MHGSPDPPHGLGFAVVVNPLRYPQLPLESFAPNRSLGLEASQYTWVGPQNLEAQTQRGENLIKTTPVIQKAPPSAIRPKVARNDLLGLVFQVCLEGLRN